MESLQSPSRWPWNRYSHGGHGITAVTVTVAMESLQSPWPWNRYSHRGHGITTVTVAMESLQSPWP